MLNGCGFHLRHSMHQLGTKYHTVLLAPSGSNTLHQALQRALIASSVHVVEHVPLDENIPKLIVVAQQITQFPLVYGPDGELRRERLTMAISFSFSRPGKTSEFSLSTERDRQLNSNQHLGDNAEKILIEQEMQADIISQLLLLLSHQ